jgi:hypothetical protein
MPLFAGQIVHKRMGCLNVILKAIHSFETSITISQTRGRDITKDVHLRGHHCENFGSRN